MIVTKSYYTHTQTHTLKSIMYNLNTHNFIYNSVHFNKDKYNFGIHQGTLL